MTGNVLKLKRMLLWFAVLSLAACAGAPKRDWYRDPNMDFAAIQAVAVLPFSNLTRDTLAAEKVRDAFINKLLSTEAVYVLPTGEVARGIGRAEIQSPATPSGDEIVKLGGILKVQAVITGAVKEFAEVRSGTAAANAVSLSLEMIETQTGKVVWSAASTKGGITFWDRLFGGGGRPITETTEEAVSDAVRKLFS